MDLLGGKEGMSLSALSSQLLPCCGGDGEVIEAKEPQG